MRERKRDCAKIKHCSFPVEVRQILERIKIDDKFIPATARVTILLSLPEEFFTFNLYCPASFGSTACILSVVVVSVFSTENFSPPAFAKSLAPYK